MRRSAVWGLAIAGERGVDHVVRSVLAEFDLSLGLSGFRSSGELDSGVLQTI